MKNGYAWFAFYRLLVAGFFLLPSVFTFSTVQANPPQAHEGLPMGALPIGIKNVQTAKAVQLVQLALQSEVDGWSARRDTHLDRALQMAPDFAPAHWHRGNVRIDQQWIGVAEAQRQAVGDPRFAQYGQLYDQFADTLEGQINLARWCQQQGLENQQQFHWSQVLAQNPAHQQAQQALGVHLVAGQLLTKEEIEQQREQRKKLKRLTRQLKVQIDRWLRQWKRGTADERKAVLAQIRTWDQSLAIPQIERDLSGRKGEISLAIVDALSRMADDRATMSLLRHAVLSPFAEVRSMATGRLSRRPLHDYVPTLMGQLQVPVESSYSVVPHNDGSVSYTHEIYEEGHEQNLNKTFLGTFRQDSERRNYALNTSFRPRTGQQRVTLRMLTATEIRQVAREKQRRSMGRTKSYLAQAINLEQNLGQLNQSREDKNERIIAVLAQTTEQYLGEDPKSWWQWWRSYNELAPYEIPTYERTYTDWQYDRSLRPYDSLTIVPSCFPQGTLVWTRVGQKPIETVHKGDWVLAQDPDTGQLAFQPVLATTFREPSPLIELMAGGRSLRATLGHPFWVNGKGWRMAKQLQVGDRLHTVRGCLAIDRVEAIDSEDAYNLVVHDFRTYFVGTVGLLVHDNTIRQPTQALVPGLAAHP